MKTPWHKTTLLVLAITLHNIPEGLAIGVLFGGVAAGIPEASIAGAVALAIGDWNSEFSRRDCGFNAHEKTRS